MVTVQSIKGRDCPVIRCDSCGERITDASAGAVVFSSPGSLPKFLCKPFCSTLPQYREKSWMGLDTFMAHLLANVGLKGKKLDEARAVAGASA